MIVTTPMGERIRSLRQRAGFTLDRLAAESGCSKSYIWELENKNPPRPSAEKLANIAKALNTTVDALIGTDVPEDDLSPEDKVFFRKYRGLDETEKERFRRMIDLWDD